ncbi:peptidase inhibitor family I36 protein [Catellatospora aurea]|uniref:Peptidase inhibitor family I36 protein n=1 Tax=Catellatospora aurea TaxID=1337874 RepID=A0ABW2GY50_9ACTN
MTVISKKAGARLAGVALAVASSVGLVFATAAPVSAAPAYIKLWSVQDVGASEEGYCDTGYFCAYISTNLTSQGIGFYNDKWDWAATDVPNTFSGYDINNNAESWWNHGTPSFNNDVQVYQYAGGSGVSMCVQNGVQIKYGSSYGMANLPSAHVWRSSC